MAPENRSSEYPPDDYHYSPSLEPRIVEVQGGIYGPYTGTLFDSIRDTNIARPEAHNSGPCAADPNTKEEFASDLINLTLVPSVNRHQKSDKDVAEWLPQLNECWYVDRIIQVHPEHGFTIERAEANTITTVLAPCHPREKTVLASTTRENQASTPFFAESRNRSRLPAPLARTPASDPTRANCAKFTGLTAVCGADFAQPQIRW